MTSDLGDDPNSLNEFMNRKAWDPAWYETIVFLTGQVREAWPLLRKLADESRDDVSRHRLALAGRCLGQIRGAQIQEAPASLLRDEIAEALLSAAGRQFDSTLDVPDHLSQGLRGVALADSYYPCVPLGDLILSRAHDEQSAFLVAVMNCLWDIVPTLVDTSVIIDYMSSTYWWERELALRAVEAHGDTLAPDRTLISALVRRLANDRDELVAASAAKALAAVEEAAAEHPQVLPALLDRCLRAGSQSVRRAAAEAMVVLAGTAELQRHAQALVASLREETDPELRYHAVRALAALCPTLEVPGVIVAPLLACALHDMDEWVRGEALEALGGLGQAASSHPSVIPSLSKLLRVGGFWERFKAARALGALGAAEIEAIAVGLSDALGDPDEHVRAEAARALAAVGEAALARPTVVEKLLQYLRSADWYDRCCAAEALGAMGRAVANEPNVIRELIDGLGDPEVHVRQRAASALGKLGVPQRDDRALNALLHLLETDCELTVREAAATALASVGEATAGSSVIQTLMRKSKSETFRVRLAAGRALAAIESAGIRIFAMDGPSQLGTEWRLANVRELAIT